MKQPRIRNGNWSEVLCLCVVCSSVCLAIFETVARQETEKKLAAAKAEAAKYAGMPRVGTERGRTIIDCGTDTRMFNAINDLVKIDGPGVTVRCEFQK